MVSRAKKGILIVVVIFLLCFICRGFPIYRAQAQNFEQPIPTYGLYCENSSNIKSGMVNFDLSDTELLSQGIGIKRTEYKVATTNNDTEFAIPFVSSAMNLPSITVTVNDKEVEGSVWYGYSGFWQDYEFNVETTYSPVLDESIMGTLYTCVPDSDTMTVSLSLIEQSGYIYETTNHFSSSHTAKGSHTWTFKNANPLHEYSFFIFGDSTGHSFESSCEYRTEIVSCKEFIESQYEYFKEYYEHSGGVPIELFYSIANRVLQEGISLSYDELFFKSIDTYRVNAYKFSVLLETDSVIRYELPVSVQRDNAFDPPIFMIEQKRTGNYDTKYTIDLNSDIPHIIESSIGTQKNGLSYIAETKEDFYFVFSASENPINTLNNNKSSNVGLIIGIVFGGVAFVVLVVSVGILVYCRKGH